MPRSTPAAETGQAALAAILVRRGWWREPAMLRAAEPVLVRLCAHYLLSESNGRRALDPVAHFHLSNGARIERIRMLADMSERGVRESATLMVNYLYDPARIEDYHEDYAGEGKRNASTTVRRLARGWSTPIGRAPATCGFPTGGTGSSAMSARASIPRPASASA